MIDPSPLRALERDMGRDAAVDLLRRFLADAREHLEAISAARRAGDPAAVRMPAHALTSTCATFGLTRMVDLARLADDAGRAGDRTALAWADALLRVAADDLPKLEQLAPELRNG
jgi:HPt (histidine-containing phosphotransfer) domain-containing protein